MKKVAILFFLLGLLMIYLFSNLSIIGFITYEQMSMVWDFSDPSDYIYDASLVNVSSGASLAVVASVVEYTSHTTNKSFISSAIKDDDDDSDKVMYLDDEWLNLGKDDVLNLTFSHSVLNITMYIDPDKSGEIRVCSSPSCNVIYGSFSHSSAKAWFSVSGIPSVHTLYVDGSQKVKFDYLEGNYTDNYTYSLSASSYAASGVVETNDLFEDGSRWGKFYSIETLNNGSVEYSFSTDSGSSWSSVFNGDDLPDLNSSSLRIRALIYGSGLSTPVISSFGLNYTVVSCAESWSASYGDCLPDNSKLLYYADLNGCGTSDGIPSDNGTYSACDYCVPYFSNVNSSCSNDDLFNVTYFYTNDCCIETGLESDCIIPANRTDSCDFCIPSLSELNGSCELNDSISSHFVDLNNCFSLTGLQSDNGFPDNKTYICDYCFPEIQMFNSSCSINDSLVMFANDSNGCFSSTGLASDSVPANASFSCDYCLPSWNCTEFLSCNKENVSVCNAVADGNNCYGLTLLSSDAFYGNYSEYSSSCVFDYDAPNLTGFSFSSSVISLGDNLSVFANITDLNNISASAVVFREGRNVSVVEAAFENGSFRFMINGTEKGVNSVLMMIVDSNNNSANYSIGSFAVSADSINTRFLNNDKQVVAGAGNASIMINLSDYSNGSVSIATYSSSIRNVSSSKAGTGRYVEIIPDDPVAFVFSFAVIRIDYDDLDISGIDETSLAIYFLNETSYEWIRLNSSVNVSGNYVEAYSYHLSYFGLFGDFISVASSSSGSSGSSGSGGGSGGGGSEGIIGSVMEAEQKKELLSETNVEPFKEELIRQENVVPECTYSMSSSLDQSVSLLDNRTYSVTFLNSGSCDMDAIEVFLSESLKDSVQLNFESGDLPAYFGLQQKIHLLPASINPAGFLVKTYERKLRNYSGEVNVVGKVNGTAVIVDRFPLTVTVEELEKISPSVNMYPALVIGIFATVSVVFILRMKKKK